jgi:hypothetical protein
MIWFAVAANCFPIGVSFLRCNPAFLRILAALLILSILPMRADESATTSDSGANVASLNGTWQIVQDPQNQGEAAEWFKSDFFPAAQAKPIQVPGVPTEVFPSTSWWMNDPDQTFWYFRTFPLQGSLEPHMRYYLRFGAVRQISDVWLNGTHLGSHGGGEDPFEFDVTKFLQSGTTNTLAVRVKMNLLGGIWQAVKLVAQPEVRIIDSFAKPDAKGKKIDLEVTLENNTGAPARVLVRACLEEWKGRMLTTQPAATVTAAPGLSVANLVIPVAQPHLWDLNDPFLYEIIVGSDWKSVDSAKPLRDEYSFRTGFRDFRVVDGYFYLNGRRIFPASAHGNQYDALYGQGTSRDMSQFYKELDQLKKAGFNMMRCITAAAMPEQLDHADETGMLYFTEHETAWLLKDPAQYGRTLNQVVRRDRNHPSLVLWGLLNETPDQRIYQRAKAWLPALRAIDDTRPVLLSSGRFDGDFKTASLSNTGSQTWDTYLGGEDPIDPKPTGALTELGAYKNGTGDMHVYPFYPLNWSFLTAFSKVGQDTHNFFLSEYGVSSAYNPFPEEREMKRLQIPDWVYSWYWITRGRDGMKHTWATYGLDATYPNMEDMMIDSDLSAVRQRNLSFSAIRGNPKIIGYNLTSIQEFWGASEGVLDNFRNFKPGHLEMLRAGWAPLRWCLFVNPTTAYADQPLSLRISLANEDVLSAGDQAATVAITGPGGDAWKQAFTVHVQANGPLAYPLFDQDVTIPNLAPGKYTMQATLDGHANAAADHYDFTIKSRAELPKIAGDVTVAGVPQNLRDLLTTQGAKLRDYAVDEKINRETIVVGGDFKGGATQWRSLYGRAAQGAHLVFLDENVFHGPGGANQWLAVAAKGGQNGDPDWLYHKETVAKTGNPIFAGLPTKLMDPDDYGMMLANDHFFEGTTTPDDTAAVAIRSTLGNHYEYKDGFLIGTYKLGAGHFTVNAFDLLGTIGAPATDRMLLNFVLAAQADAAAVALPPDDFATTMDKLGIVDPPPAAGH